MMLKNSMLTMVHNGPRIVDINKQHQQDKSNKRSETAIKMFSSNGISSPKADKLSKLTCQELSK
ncbi:CLUMA_CG015697, isoform A [Clunio marinus]|uniref:CLUMA_CG015697, isoform A n=1 Tax=Clunio marinus TaxID=568069 RepID=A0A1J1IPE1_9DIPT|nr:CLUMA_CG015697, isoform A [Clunio marinus]